MDNLAYHKGSFCIYTPIFCQEGYCSECDIYRRKQLLVKMNDYRDLLKNSRQLQEAAISSNHR